MSKYVKKIKEESNIFGDEIAYLQHWDFSRANLNDESRIEAITTVASICYDNPNVVGKENLYNRLKAEAMGLPSSSFEFVPVLLDNYKFDEIVLSAIKHFRNEEGDDRFILNIEKYGEWIIDNGIEYLLTNYRALLADHEILKNAFDYNDDITQFYNTKEECNIIKKYNNTFLCKMDISTSKQHNRHRISLQELSRRYVSGKKTEFEFYYSKGLDKVVSLNKRVESPDDIINEQFSTRDLTQLMIDHYFEALKQKVKPQEARRILPQSMYTIVWSSFLPFQLENYLGLRDDLHAQDEIRWIAQAMKRLLKRD